MIELYMNGVMKFNLCGNSLVNLRRNDSEVFKTHRIIQLNVTLYKATQPGY